MKIIYGLKGIRKFKEPVVVLGVFDGVHLGHRKIIRAAVRQAKRAGGRSVLVTFWPHPQKEKTLYSLEHRLKLIAELGMQVAVVVKFDRSFSLIPAKSFILKILLKKLGARVIFVGKNFSFGKGAFGNVMLLNEFSRRYNFKLKIFDVIKIGRRAISSTYIRKLIQDGDLKVAERLLGRPVSVLGTVVHGTSLARKLGFPTANIDPHHEVLPTAGVYAVKTIISAKTFKGICYIGPRPTFIRESFRGIMEKEKHVEVHIFNFKQNIYGRNLEIQFVKSLRKSRKFSSLQNLASQVKKDILQVKKLFFAS